MARRSGRAPTGVGVCPLGALAIAALLAAGPAAAVDYVWNNAAGGNWSVAANWTPSGVPSSNADTATITLAGTYTVTVDGGFFVKTVTLGGASGTQTLAVPATRSLVFAANVGTPTMAVNANGVLALSGGSLQTGGQPTTVAMNGLWNWTGGSVNTGVAVTVGPGATLAMSGSSSKTLFGSGAAITNNGTITLTGSDNLYAENGAVLTNAASGTFDLQANVGIVQTGAGGSTLNNAGLLRKSGGAGTSTVSLITINNTGTIDAQSGTLAITQPFASGAVQSTGAGNALNAQPGAALTIGAITSATFAGTTFGGAGAKSIGTVGNTTIPHTYSGTIAATNTTILGGIQRGTFTLNGDMALSAGTLATGGSFAMTVPAGATFTFTGGGAKQLVGGGGFLARIINSGTLRFSSTSSLQGDSNAFIQNTAGGLIEFLAQGGLGTTGGAGASVLQNAGTVRFASGTTVPVAGWAIVNTGTISVQSGLFAWSGSSGSVNFGQTAGRLELVGGNMSNERFLSISGGVLTGTGTIQGPGAVTVGGGPAQTRPGTSPGQITIGGALTQTGSLIVELNGPVAGTQYDQIVAQGNVSVGGTLLVSLAGVPAVGTVYRIIDKQGAGGVVGAFTALPQGAVIVVQGVQLQVSYTGGDGNDVTLTVVQNTGLICTPFTDVDQASPFCPAVQWMKNRGVTVGCAATLYCPADSTTRMQMALFMNRLGTTLTGVPETVEASPGAVDPSANPIACATASQGVVGYERRARLDAVFMGQGQGSGDFAVELVASVDNGANWIQLAPPVPAGIGNGRWSNVRVNADRDVAASEDVRYALRVTRVGGSGVLSASRCQLRLQKGNRNPAAAPDAAP